MLLNWFLWLLLTLVSLFMIMLILIQRGRGGGLAGALGGPGGQSAFGSKTGDVFTRITVVTAVIWITLSMITIKLVNPPPDLKTRDAVLNQLQGGSLSSGGDGTTDSENGDATNGSRDANGTNDVVLPGETTPPASGESGSTGSTPPATDPPLEETPPTTGGSGSGTETGGGQ